ncbi:hypothetical protein [Ferruginibacter sp.]|uniref:hypothetical protein n=1 Tax=Ferruginibacter sp. TaxID=1940288 RepID=UPI00265A8C93|nr:hypothetical protein [Ferruginibacter sp.]
MKQLLLFTFIIGSNFAKAQKVDSIFVNLYTDSLKKGTYNYINIDGHLTNGRWLPLDSSDLIFTASAGQFKGNNLWIDKDFKQEKVSIKVVLKSNPWQYKEFDIYIKQKPDNEQLKTTEQILNEMKQSRKKNSRA